MKRNECHYDVGGELQLDVASALEADLLSVADTLVALSGLVGDVPARAQAAIVQAISTLSQAQRMVADIAAGLVA